MLSARPTKALCICQTPRPIPPHAGEAPFWFPRTRGNVKGAVMLSHRWPRKSSATNDVGAVCKLPLPLNDMVRQDAGHPASPSSIARELSRRASARGLQSPSMPRLLAMALLLTACAVTPPPARQPTPIPFVPQPLTLAGDCPTLCIRRLSSSALPRRR